MIKHRARSILAVLIFGWACGAIPAEGRAAVDSPGASPKAARRTRNVILVTLDGVRIQEMFTGMDPVVSAKEKHSGIYDLERAKQRYWRETPEERRLALMPFFWGTLAPQGIVLGDKEKGSSVHPKNPLLFSAPGYAEILTGMPQPDIDSNDLKTFPHRTFLQFAQTELHLDHRRVAVVGSWDGFAILASSEPGAFFTNAGYQDVPAGIATPRMAWLSEIQHQAMALWEVGRSDAVTFGIALEYLKQHRPRLMHIALGESDDWAHARRYDRLLDYINVADGYLRDLWRAAQEIDAYRGRTTIILTTDHGRGVTPKGWVEHDEGIAGSEDVWIAVIGPDTPDLGEVAPSPTYDLANVAATALDCLGLDWRAFNAQAGAPIPGACGTGEAP